MIKEEQYHWEHLFLGHSFRNKKFLSMLKIRNKRFFLALNEHFVPIFNSNLFLLILKGPLQRGTIISKSERSQSKNENSAQK